MNRPDKKAYIHLGEYAEALEKYTNWLEDVSGVCLPSDVDDSDVVCYDEDEILTEISDEEFSCKEEVIRYFLNKIAGNLNTMMEVLDD